LPEADEGHLRVERRLVQLINNVVYVSHVGYCLTLAHLVYTEKISGTGKQQQLMA
jgi:hypothetical protein